MSEENTPMMMDSNSLGPSLTELMQLQPSADERESRNAGADEGCSTSQFQLGRKSIYSEGFSDAGKD